jgi:hypothetical protein
VLILARRAQNRNLPRLLTGELRGKPEGGHSGTLGKTVDVEKLY